VSIFPIRLAFDKSVSQEPGALSRTANRSEFFEGRPPKPAAEHFFEVNRFWDNFNLDAYVSRG
jgi:hypothetical protein